MRWLFVLWCCSIVYWSQAQTRQELEQKRQSIARALTQTNRQLESTQRYQSRTRQQLRQLRQSIATQTAALDSLQQLQAQTSTRQARHALVATALELDLEGLRADYRRLIRAAYRQAQLRQGAPNLALVGLARTAQAQLYQGSVQAARHRQLQLVQDVQQALAQSATQLSRTQSQQDTLLQTLANAQQALHSDQRKQARQMARLQKQEQQLRRTLAQQKKAKQVLSQKIEAAILQQIAAAKAKARQYQAEQKKQPRYSAATPSPLASNSATTQDFAAQRGKLLSPIYHGKIVGHYGKQAHPTLKEVYINNNGIDLQGQYNSVVRNVYTGTVVSVFAVPGLNNAVMVKHGDYYTTYSNVAKVYVKQGQHLKTGAQIGTIGRDPKGKGHLLHFELWLNKQQQNPLPWIRPQGRL